VTQPIHVDALAQELADALRGVAPERVRTGARAISTDDLAELTDTERTCVRRAVPRRQHEFATGRALLRELLGQAVAIPVAPDRSPVLPAGVVASLAHDRELAVAALSTDPDVVALGVDVEPATPLAAELAEVILRDDETGIDAHRAFTMKEAAYKAWSTLGGRMLEHHEVRLSLDGDRFRAEVVPDGSIFEGCSASVAHRWLALVVVEK
jgi:4'-phosphopantetheinyl transferase EntD